MKKKKLIISILICMVMMITCLTGCADNEDHRYSYQGSNVRSLPKEEATEIVTDKFSDFKTFNKSSYSDLTNSFKDKYNVVYYNKYFFEEKNLSVVKFNKNEGDTFFIKNITVNEKIVVDLVRTKSDKTNIATFGLFLEMPKNVNQLDVELKFEDIEKGIEHTAFTYFDEPTDKTKHIKVVTNRADLVNQVPSTNGSILQAYVNTYNDEFFENNDLALVYTNYNTGSKTELYIRDNKIVIDARFSSHYMNNGDDKVAYKLHFIPIKKGQLIDGFVSNYYEEADFNSNKVVIIENGVISE